MRERTPSADDTPKRAPPAPPREAASADVLVDGRSGRIVGADSTRASSLNSSSTDRRIITMVATGHNRDKLGTSQSTINDSPQQQSQRHQNNHQYNNNTNNNIISNHQNYPERQGIAGCRSAPTAQDKRSRLSNVINNLRKKVPSDTKTTSGTATTNVNDCHRTRETSVSAAQKREKDEDEGLNSVERNLANLEKYVMTVLNGVIKDSESSDDVKRDVDHPKIAHSTINDNKDSLLDSLGLEKNVTENNENDGERTEPSIPNESRSEAAVPSTKNPTKSEVTLNKKKHDGTRNDEILDLSKCERHDNEDERGPKQAVTSTRITEEVESKSKVKGSTIIEEARVGDPGNIVEEVSRYEDSPVDVAEATSSSVVDPQNGEAKDFSTKDDLGKAVSSNVDDKSRTLGTMILERLDHQILMDDTCANIGPDVRNEKTTDNSESNELRTICRDLLNELLNDISHLIEDEPVAKSDGKIDVVENSIDNVKDTRTEFSSTSIQCSLPLDKIASILQKCQNPPDTILSTIATTSQQPQQSTKSPAKSTSPTVRHLCLYCDRKFLSISLRQRHTDRVHQSGGGRRSERNSRKTTQSCQYCADKCADNLDSLFHHMIVNHNDKYHACVQCTTRYSTRDVLVNHMSEVHDLSADKVTDRVEKIKDNSNFKEPAHSSCRETSSQFTKDATDSAAATERKKDDDQQLEKRDIDVAASIGLVKNIVKSNKDPISNPGSPEFDSTFYSSVSCNIRENLLHHLDGKLQICTNPPGGASNEAKSSQQQFSQQAQHFYDNSANQTHFPIDISLTAATPVYNKEYGNDDFENSSEYAQKPGKTVRSHPRRVSFEKYNFPRKYDGKEQWTCSIKDLSKFDISTQLTLRKKQQFVKERLNATRIHDNNVVSENSEFCLPEMDNLGIESVVGTNLHVVDDSRNRNVEKNTLVDSRTLTNSRDQNCSSDDKETSQCSELATSVTEFTAEFGNFIRLRKWNEPNVDLKTSDDTVYAELTGEWSRPRVYICGACTSRQLTLREMEEHKAISHPNVWCSHLEFTGDQRELYKHIFLPGRCMATSKAKNAILVDKVCTKCAKICGSLAELHRHMLECGGDQAWLLGLFGNGKKKCKWRPFGSRSRRRRHRGMKRNIQNSQTARVNQRRERNSSGPRVRPSDRESIQKMLANLPPKRSSRRVMQDTTVRAQGRLVGKMQTRSRLRSVDPAISSSRLSRKAVLRNKLLKNAKSFQRKRCRGDSITAAIESVVKNNEMDDNPDETIEKSVEDLEKKVEKKEQAEEEDEEEEEEEEEEEDEEDEEDELEDDSGRVFKESRKFESAKSQDEKSKVPRNLESSNRSTKIVRGVRVVSKKHNVKSKNLQIAQSRVISNRRGVVSAANREKTRNRKRTTKNNYKVSSIVNDVKSLSSSSSSPSHSALSRRKKHVDPILSLHASLKARSQLRTNDGKFACKADVRGTRSTSNNVIVNNRNTVTKRRQIPRNRTTRPKILTGGCTSNDPKLRKKSSTKKKQSENEKVANAKVENQDNEEKNSSSKSQGETKVTTSGKTEKNSNARGNSSNNESKNGEIDLDDAIVKNVIDVTQIKNSAQSVNREQRPTRGRRKKIDDKSNDETETFLPTLDADVKPAIRKKNRSLPSRASSSADHSVESTRRGNSRETKSVEINQNEDIAKKSGKNDFPTATRKIETGKTKDTRRVRQERRAASLEDVSKIQELQDDVKKSLTPSDDILAQIGPKNRDKTRKNNSRTATRTKANSPRTRVTKKNTMDEEVKVDETIEEGITLRKSPRKADRKETRSFDEIVKEITDSANTKISVSGGEILADEPKDTAKTENNVCKRRGRIKSRIDTLEIIANGQIENETEIQLEDNSAININKSIETIVDDLQERPIEIEAPKNKDESIVVAENTEKSFATAIIESSEKSVAHKIPIQTISKKFDKKIDQSIVSKHLDESIELAISKHLDESTDEDSDKDAIDIDKNISESIIVNKDLQIPIETNDPNTEISIEEIEKDVDKSADVIVNENPDESNENVEETIDESCIDGSSTFSGNVATLNFEHLQQESSNSNIDSGKENSSETPINVTKLKVVRPKKSRGTRRERMGKRTLSNVIGILTEGVNIPVEIQQSVVLTVQTSIETTSETGQSNPSQISGSNAAAGEVSDLKSSVKPNEISDAACSTSAIEESPLIREIEDIDESQQKDTKNIENIDDNRATVIPETKTSQLEVPRYNAPQITTLPVKPVEILRSSIVEPANDIILDLSRRKPKGKGSFLEKIVSKIAKQKDALLEGEVGCLLDNAADELTNILNESSPPNVEERNFGTITARNEISDKTIVNQTISQDEGSKVTEINAPTIIVDEVKFEDKSPSMEVKVNNETNVQTENTILSNDDIISSTEGISTIVAELPKTDMSSEDREIDKSVSRRAPKKRSLDVTTPKKNKRKTVDDKSIDEDKISSEDEMCLADIMKLINRTRHRSPKSDDNSELRINSGKRKIVDVDKEENHSGAKDSTTLTEEFDDKEKSRSMGNGIKKSKRLSGKKAICENASIEKMINDDKILDSHSSVESTMPEVVQSCAEDSSIEIIATCDEKIVTNVEAKTKITEPEEIPEEKSRTRPTRKCAAKKKSLIDEHLDLSDGENSKDIFPQTIQKNDEDLTSASNENVTSILADSTMPEESFKIPDSNEFITTRKRSTRKKSLADCLSSFVNTELSKNLLHADSLEIEKQNSDETRQIVCEKDKKIDDPIDTVEDKISTLEMEEASQIINPNETGNELEVEKSSTNKPEKESVTIEETKKIETTEDNLNIDDGANTKSGNDELIQDETATGFSDAKLQRKFAVVHTKSGKILIVEKKKKFTKEAAKFFCEICAASFTRKSSLKKHNSSQSHLLQVAKYCDDTDKDTTIEDEKIVDYSSTNNEQIIDNAETKDPIVTHLDDQRIIDKLEDDANVSIDGKKLEESQEENAPDVNDDDEERECDEEVRRKDETEDVTLGEEKLIEDDLEDELLDEEICKITENMTHDEYVLTDHVSPIVPEVATTPIVEKLIEEADGLETMKNIEETKKEKEKRESDEAKTNLADEHLSLDSPVSDELMAEVTFTLENPIEKSITDVTLDLNILEPTKSTIEQENAEIVDDKSNKETDENIVMKLNSETMRTEDSVIEKSSNSRRRSKRNVAKVNEKVLNVDEISVPEIKDNQDISISDTDCSIAGTIEKSITESEETKNEKSIIDEEESLHEDLQKSLNNFEQSGKIVSPVLDFSNITAKLQSRLNTENSCPVEFDSDDDNSDVIISDDIRKILDDPELNTENQQKNVEPMSPENIEKIVTREKIDSPEVVVAPSKRSKQKSKSEESSGSKKEKVSKKSSRNKNVSKENVKKSKNGKNSRKNSNSSKTRIDDAGESDYDDKKDVIESQNKSKIVKCVFGRVFGGEKVDKVKEVLDDWVSRSEGDSHDEIQTTLNSANANFNMIKESTIIPTESKRSLKEEVKTSKVVSPSSSVSKSLSPEIGRGKKRGRSKIDDGTSGLEYTEIDDESSRSKNGAQTRRRNVDRKASSNANPVQPSNDLGISSRCRQSKKRAEERISRAFEDESSIPFDEVDLLSQLTTLTPTKTSRDDDEKEAEVKPMSKRQTTSGKSKKRALHDDLEDKNESDESEGEENTRKSSNDTSRSKGERSVSPDEKNSQKIVIVDEDAADALSDIGQLDDNNDNDDDDDDNEDEIALGRLSPLYVCNTPENSINSSSNSDDNDEEDDDEDNSGENRTGSTCGFKNDNVKPRSPLSIASNHDELTEISTHDTNDANEENAMDEASVRAENSSSSQKSRQGKVLNFDEELFVECCSRLKATTENELRGAKKIKLDHNEAYERNDEEAQGFRGGRDRWRDVESQNSLGSLLESVNQLLGEEMYSGGRNTDYQKRGRNNDSEKSSGSASPDVETMNRQENLGYEDSLDVAFEHNNKLRVKIQQRMRESENLIASTFGQKASSRHHHHHHHHHHHNRGTSHQRNHDGSHSHRRQVEHGRKEQTTTTDRSTIVDDDVPNNESYDDRDSVKNNGHSDKDVELDCSGFRSKNPALGGLLDNLLQSNGKHDHNGSTPMNVLAELACARVPTSMIPDLEVSKRDKSSKSPTRTRDSTCGDRAIIEREVVPKKPRNPIRELFERKKELNERKHHERAESGEVALRELNAQRQKRSKKSKKQPNQDFPLIRKSQLGGMAERKKRRDDRKTTTNIGASQERIKDVYDFDDDESQQESSSVLSYRNKSDKTSDISKSDKPKNLDMTDVMTMTIGETLNNGKSGDALGRRLESMVDRKFQEIETPAPKTKGALKSFQIEEKQHRQKESRTERGQTKNVTEKMENEEAEQEAEENERKRVIGPMDGYVERKRGSRKVVESTKHGKTKKRGKSAKKKSRNAWYENDSSDEFVTAAKAEDVGVGTTKSQRTCSKGKQNLFAELSTSSESDYENENNDYETKKCLSRNGKNSSDKNRDKDHGLTTSPVLADNYPEDQMVVDWMNVSSKTDSKNEPENKKSESEMSDHPLVIDERKLETDEARLSDDDTENRSVTAFELDDLYREDTTDETDEDSNDHRDHTEDNENSRITIDEKINVNNENDIYSEEKELIPLEEALDLLDNNEDMSRMSERVREISRCEDSSNKEEESLSKRNDILSLERDDMDEDNDNNLGITINNDDETDETIILPEKLTSNVKPQKTSDNLPLHVFLSRKVQESKKRKQQQQKKLQEEQDRILMDYQSTRRQRKCAIGKQGLLAEISSSDDDSYARETCRRTIVDKTDNDKQTKKPKRESKEKRKERYIEKKHEQIIAKEQKAIEEEILRELERTKSSGGRSDSESFKSDKNVLENETIVGDKSEVDENKLSKVIAKRKRSEKSRKSVKAIDSRKIDEKHDDDSTRINNEPRVNSDENLSVIERESSGKTKKSTKSGQKKKSPKISEAKCTSANRKSRISNGEKTRNKITSSCTRKETKERRSSSGKRDSDDEELRTTKCWNKVDEGVGVAIGRRKRAAANQLYYWSSSSDEDEPVPITTSVVEEEEDDRQEQHGWIVGDSHKRMITMLAMEKQLKEKRRRSEDEFEPGKTKNKKHRNSTS